MSNVIYVQGDLFKTAPKYELLGHSVNCRGVWGNGIALQFKYKFPQAFTEYSKSCSKKENIGTVEVFGRVVCFFTSKNYGKYKDSPELIINNTRLSIADFVIKRLEREIHIPKINSGLFGVPWKDTEQVLKEFPEITFYVYSLDNI